MEGRERREWSLLGIREYVQEVRETKKGDINIKVLGGREWERGPALRWDGEGGLIDWCKSGWLMWSTMRSSPPANR
jgi:hypothetical protein